MVAKITLEQPLYFRLLEAIDYAITRLELHDDRPSIEYLKEQREFVARRVENERTGGGDTTCTQIDTILTLLEEDDG
jgi:hypothetical protein